MEDGEKETITISSCPVCSEEHAYTLRVSRSQTIGLATQGSWQKREQQRRKRILRLFTCPTKNETFQATLTLWELPSAPINSVEVEKCYSEKNEGSLGMDKDDATKAQRHVHKVEVSQVGAVSPHNKAVYEAGKTMLIDSIKTGRDFCQFMITTSTGAIPLYLAIITFLLPKNYSLDLLMGIVVAGPAVLFLLAVLIFAYGYFPTSDYFSLDVIEEIEMARNRNIDRRRKFATA